MAFMKNNNVNQEMIDSCCKSLVLSGRTNMINQYDKNLAPIFEIMGIEFFSNA
jgi:hypothetical protein